MTCCQVMLMAVARHIVACLRTEVLLPCQEVSHKAGFSILCLSAEGHSELADWSLLWISAKPRRA